MPRPQNFSRTGEIPFSSETKTMLVSGTVTPSGPSVMASQQQATIYLKGSIEAVLERCKTYYLSESSPAVAIDAPVRAAILAEASSVASRGLRVVGMAFGAAPLPSPSSSLADNTDALSNTSDLTFAGFQAMLDPPRRGVSDAILALQTAGIQVVMITGDAEQTALSIARELGLKVNAGDSTSCLTGKQIDALTERQLEERVHGIAVFARVTPRHKMRIVGALQRGGKVVAMTGDGGETRSLIHGPV